MRTDVRLVMAAMLGTLSREMVDALPDMKEPEPRAMTDADRERIAAADAKRQRRAAKRLGVKS